MTRAEAAELVKEFDRVARSGVLKLTTQPNEDFWTLYISALADYDLIVARAAMQRYIRTAGMVFFPTPGQLIELVEGAGDDRGLQAWLIFNEAIHLIGNFKSLIVEDAALGRALAQVFGGWIDACDTRAITEEPTWQARKKEFVSSYRFHSMAAPCEADPIWFDGFCVQQNRENLGRWDWHLQQLIEYAGVITRSFELQERRVELDGKTLARLLPLRDILALPQPMRTSVAALPPSDPVEVFTPEQRAKALAHLHSEFQRVLQQRGML
jgi:hypothetical protein